MSGIDLSHFFSGSKKWSFTLELGRGETYSNNRPTLYAHSTYERNSVLAGRPQRVFVDSWDSLEKAEAELSDAKGQWRKFKYEDMIERGSSHIPIRDIVSHLPDDTDY